MIDQQTIERIINAADIIEIISEFVRLKRTGSNYMGLCPFHNEKTPSFSVSPSKGIYKCFGCGKAGNVVNFIMEHENLTYPEALKFLAKRYNIDIVEKEFTPEEIKQQSERESLMVVVDFASRYYIENLHKTEEGRAVGLSYFRERGFRDDIIDKFQLGYSPEKRDAFTNWAIKNGYKPEYLIKSGLTIQKDNYYFDRFSGRVIFPIHNLSGNVIAFGGRTLKTDKSVSKYLNSPESEIYYKSKTLYGIFQAKKAIVQNDKCFLVEGYTDVISMHQAGIENVVASSGTSLTVDQIKLIKRFTPNITVLYDGDAAGIKASIRGIDLILEEGLNVKAVLLPDGDDPDSFARKNNATAFNDYIKANETDFIHFKLKLLLEDAQNDPIKKAGLISDIVKSIAIIPNPVIRSMYIKECSYLMKVDERLLYSETNKIRRQRAEQKYLRIHSAADKNTIVTENTNLPEISITLTSDEYLERELIRLLLNYGNKILIEPSDISKQGLTTAKYIIDEIISDELEFHNPVYRQIFEECLYQINSNNIINEKYFLHHPDKSISTLTIDMTSHKYHESKLWKRTGNYIEKEEDKLKTVVKETILAFKSKRLNQLIDEIQKNIASAIQSQNNEEIDILFEQYSELIKLKVKIAKALGIRTIIG
jgi:DNA primase